MVSLAKGSLVGAFTFQDRHTGVVALAELLPRLGNRLRYPRSLLEIEYFDHDFTFVVILFLCYLHLLRRAPVTSPTALGYEVVMTMNP